ncbi:MAG: hypothetical protein IKY67_14960, partial [Paludibacteraceae bacterium]|nr:hypothetical protein [Paludibacteraceae bacterium]
SGDRADARAVRPYFSPLPVMVVPFLQYGIAKSSKSSNFAKLTVNFEEFADLSLRNVFRYTRSIVGRK